MTAFKNAVEKIRNSQRMTVLTGSGVSQESGVPTFRDAISGLWANYDPQQLATSAAFQANPSLVWDWYEYRRKLVDAAKPNEGHFALATLQKRHPHLTLITQNVDALHETAGSQNVIHLHGNIAQSKCFYDCLGSPTLIDLTTINTNSSPPACPHCGRWVRPNVVWFGEPLPEDALEHAHVASIQCDLMLIIGTSGSVEPAASFARVAKVTGATIIEINPEHTLLTTLADIKLSETSAKILPALVAEVYNDG